MLVNILPLADSIALYIGGVVPRARHERRGRHTRYVAPAGRKGARETESETLRAGDPFTLEQPHITDDNDTKLLRRGGVMRAS